MNFKLILFFCTFFSSASIFAQDLPCNCLDNLNETIKKTEIDYAGFPAKVNKASRAAYDVLVKKLSLNAKLKNDPKSCFYLIRDYIRFFNDKHFSFTYLSKDDYDKETIAVDEPYLRSSGLGKTDAVEGRWTNPDSSLILEIKKFRKGEYKAAVVRSNDQKLSKGMVYFSLRSHKKGFLLKQYNVFNSVDFYAQQRGGLLQLWNFELFGKISSTGMTIGEKDELNNWRNNNNGLAFKQLDDETNYIKIPTFFNNDSKIEKLITGNDRAIRARKYLIIDLRGNGGGNSGWSFLLPYVMTNPIAQDSPLLRISQDNVKLKRAELEFVVTNPLPPEMKKYYPDEYVARLKKVYDELPVAKSDFYTVPGLVIPLDSSLRFPAKVALITDELCGSSTEYFFHLMKQSKKTTRYGTNSVGMMDYEGPTATTPLPFKQFILMIPVSKSSWTSNNPIDETGFTPDVKLTIPDKEWVNYIKEDLKKTKSGFPVKK